MTDWNEFDAGGSGNAGPFLQWTARGTQDGAVPAQSFYLREREGTKKNVTDKITSGLILDIGNIKTGWQESGGTVGVAPKWKFNDSLNHFTPSPGEEWKRGFQIPIALPNPTASAMWEQAGAGAWQAFVNIVHQLKVDDQSPKLPVVKLTQIHTLHLGKGTTHWPDLAIVAWVDRPECLQEPAQSIAASADIGQTHAESSITPPPPKGNASDLNDEIPF